MTLADVLITPRNRGTNPPMKIYAYMQSGRPIVSTNVPTHTQILDDQTAFLVNTDPESLAKGILDVLGNSDKARTVALAARERVEQKYSLLKFREKVRAAYTSLFSGCERIAG